ncbi:MAG: DUF2868 domain-containing protein [Oligoflexus sp.]
MFLKSGNLFQSPPLKGEEIFDLEWQNQADQLEQTSSSMLHERDRKIGIMWQQANNHRIEVRKVHLPQAEIRHLFRFWLQQVHPETASPGGQFFSQVRTGLRLLMIIGFLLGYSAMSAVAYYDGRNPVNAFHFLIFFVGFQLILAIFAAFSLRYILSHKNQPLELGLIQQLMAKILVSVTRWREHLMEKKEPPRQQGPHRLSIMTNQLPTLWSLLLFQGLQTISLFFLSGSLISFLILVIFSDLAFAWGSTLQISVEMVQSIVNALALPWTWWQPEWVPSFEVLEKTQYFRIEARYVGTPDTSRTTDPRVLGEWWTFLCMSLITYGLLPRCVLWILAKVSLNKYYKNYDLDNLAFKELQRRLMLPHIKWESTDSEDKVITKSKTDLVKIASSSPQKGVLIIWRDLPASASMLGQYYRDKFQVTVEQIYTLDGSQKNLQEMLSRLQERPLKDMSILISVEDFEEPGKAIQKLIHSLRQAVDEKLPIQIHLLQISESRIREATLDRFRLWQGFFKQFHDPYLGIYSGE